MFGNYETVTYWSTSYPIEAIRLTPENMQGLADYFGGEYKEQDPDCELTPKEPVIGINGWNGWPGDWLFRRQGGEILRIIPHQNFVQEYHTHSERMANDETYAKVFQHVMSAMKSQGDATFYGDTNGMDIVAVNTTNSIMGLFASPPEK